MLKQHPASAPKLDVLVTTPSLSPQIRRPYNNTQPQPPIRRPYNKKKVYCDRAVSFTCEFGQHIKL